MSSRMDKYSSNTETTSRSSRNKHLYEELYSDTSYTNSVVIDDSKEIDINKIKELIDREEKNQKVRPIKSSKELYDDIDIIKEEVNQKVYDINEVLKDAKSKRDILEDANEKKKGNIKYQSHLDIEKELAKTRKVYDKLLQEETELLDIMNTLTNMPREKKDDLYKDLTSEANKLKTGTVDVKEIKDKVSDETKETTEYSTNTFMFDKKDFVTEDSLKEHLEGTNKFIKLLIFLLSVAVVLAGYYVVTTYILKK